MDYMDSRPMGLSATIFIRNWSIKRLNSVE